MASAFVFMGPKAQSNIYGPFIAAIEGKDGGYYPTVVDGVRAMNWLEACWESHKKRE